MRSFTNGHSGTILAVALVLLSLAAGISMRLDQLHQRYPNELMVAGSAMEYQMLAEHLLEPQKVAPPGNPIGLSLLLAVLFASLPVAASLTQVSSTVVLSLSLVPLGFVLAKKLMGSSWATLAALLIAINATMATNAVRGTTKELYAVGLLIVLLLYLRVRHSDRLSIWRYVLLGASVGCLMLIRQDGALVIAPLFVACIVKERPERGILSALPYVGLVVALPLATLLFNGWYYDLYGIKSTFWRGARSYFWFDFFRGRMPWEYMFYAKINLIDWWFGHHSISEMFAIVVKSTVRTTIAIGESMWGLHMLGLALLGAVSYVRKERDFVLVLAIPLSLIPQLLWSAFSSNEDAFRYIVRILPLVIVMAVLGIRILLKAIPEFCKEVGFKRPSTRATTGVLTAAFVMFTVAPGSAYSEVLPYVSFQELEECHSINRDVHNRLAETWRLFEAGVIESHEAQRRVESLLAEQPIYAPSYYVSGMAALASGSLPDAASRFETALEIVPYFAEAGMFLAEVYLLQGRKGEAEELLARLTRERPEFAILHLQYGLVLHAANATEQAVEEYERYNRSQLREALSRKERIWQRTGVEERAVAAKRRRAQVEGADFVLTTPTLWQFQGLDLNGLGIPIPFDLNACQELGLLYARLGRFDEAVRCWQAATVYAPTDVTVWNNLAVAFVEIGDLGKAESALRRGLEQTLGEAVLWLSMAKVSKLQGNTDYALACYQKFLELDPGNEIAVQMSNLLEGDDGYEMLSQLHEMRFLAGRRVLPFTRASIEQSQA